MIEVSVLLLTYSDCFFSFSGKMGRRCDRKTVVDPKLRVRGIKGLRQIDAGVMPYIISGNTNAPTIMIGEHGADLIKEEYKRYPRDEL